MKKETLYQLKKKTLLREMDRLGWPSKNFTNKEINLLVNKLFKGFDGKEVRSFGKQMVEAGDDNIVLTAVRGTIDARRRAQIESFSLDVEKEGTFGQQVARQNFSDFYGYDVFKFIKDKGIQEFNISNGEYVDPETGDTKSFIGGM